MSWIDDNKSEIAEAEWEGLDNKRSTRDSPKAWKLEEYREYSDLSHRKYALRNGLNPDEQVRYNKLSLHFEMFDNRHLVFDAYDTLKAKHERVLQMLEMAETILKRAEFDYRMALESETGLNVVGHRDILNGLAQIEELKK